MHPCIAIVSYRHTAFEVDIRTVLPHVLNIGFTKVKSPTCYGHTSYGGVIDDDTDHTSRTMAWCRNYFYVFVNFKRILEKKLVTSIILAILGGKYIMLHKSNPAWQSHGNRYNRFLSHTGTICFPSCQVIRRPSNEE